MIGRVGQPEYPQDLLRRHGFVRCNCACGGVIEAKSLMPTDVHAAVYRHNRTAEHEAGMVIWREAVWKS